VSALTPGEELVLVRSGPWRLLVPLRHVERVHEAALPSPVPGAAAHPRLCVRGDLLPVLFCEALLGASEVALSPSDKLLELASGDLRGLLWVGAVEELVPYCPVEGGGGGAPPGLALGFSGSAGALPVLDVAAALAGAAAAGVKLA
jgi:hypothetical protein